MRWLKNLEVRSPKLIAVPVLEILKSSFSESSIFFQNGLYLFKTTPPSLRDDRVAEQRTSKKLRTSTTWKRWKVSARPNTRGQSCLVDLGLLNMWTRHVIISVVPSGWGTHSVGLHLQLFCSVILSSSLSIIFSHSSTVTIAGLKRQFSRTFLKKRVRFHAFFTRKFCA